jgi:hypothetical protein
MAERSKPARFSGPVLDAIRRSHVVGIRAGSGSHRIIAIWAVVVEGRVFARSWGVKRGGWYATFLEEPRGILEIAGRPLRVRAVRTRSERLMDEVSRAYAEKYHTPGSRRWVRDLCRPKSRATTTELVPV